MKESTTKCQLKGPAAGQERCSVWRRGTQARPVAPSASKWANNARRNAIQQQRRGHPSRPLSRTGRQEGAKVFNEVRSRPGNRRDR